jgi:hypothetical protein
MLAQDQIILSTLEEIRNPMEVIKGVFSEIKIDELRDMLSKVIEVCLTTKNQEFCKADSRYELLSTFKKIERLIAAVALLRN